MVGNAHKYLLAHQAGLIGFTIKLRKEPHKG
jgi:hypothetical protein